MTVLEFQLLFIEYQKNMPLQKSPVNRLVLRFIVLVLLGVCTFYIKTHPNTFTSKTSSNTVNSGVTELAYLRQAFENQQSNFQVKQAGRIIKILRDDDREPRHQRFVVQLESGQNLLIAHNIDLAPKVEGLMEGEEVSFHGEYEWNTRGGVVHWTHHDPKGLHPDGWLQYGNRNYD
jgi:Protein of unknown function (DUF3465)